MSAPWRADTAQEIERAAVEAEAVIVRHEFCQALTTAYTQMQTSLNRLNRYREQPEDMRDVVAALERVETAMDEMGVLE